MIEELKKPCRLPAAFLGDTIFVEPVTTTGVRLRFYTDTGGDDWMYHSTAARLGLVDGVSRCWTTVRMPEFRSGMWVPSPRTDGSIMLNPMPEELDAPGGPTAGVLGQSWFGRYPCEIDYTAESFVLHPAMPADLGPAVELGIAESGGRRLTNFARIDASVEGEHLDLLLDTGAQTELAPGVRARLGGGAVRATSFVISSVLTRWRAEHPDWPVIEQAEAGSGSAMIQVPAVHVGGLGTGPVWFTERADRNFLDYVSQWTDRTVVGALGGNALRGFRVLLDIPGGRLFLCPDVGGA